MNFSKEKNSFSSDGGIFSDKVNLAHILFETEIPGIEQQFHNGSTGEHAAVQHASRLMCWYLENVFMLTSHIALICSVYVKKHNEQL